MKKDFSTKVNKSLLMKQAWTIFRSENISFSDALKKSWAICKNGYLPTIEAIYKQNYKSVYNFVLNRINLKSEIAEEITADVFIKANKHLPNYDGQIAKINTWLFSIAKNSIIDYYRQNAKNTKVNVGDWQDDDGNEYYQFSCDSDSSSLVENNELKLKINKAFESLKPKYREIAEMYFINEMKYEEIAESLNIPLGTVKGMLNRCREMLQSKLKYITPE